MVNVISRVHSSVVSILDSLVIYGLVKNAPPNEYCALRVLVTSG